MVAEPIKNETRVLARAVELVVAQFEGRYLLLSGSLELRKAVIQYLPKHIHQSVVDEFSVEIHARPAAIAAAAEPAQRTIEAREEVATMQKVVDLGPDGSGWGEQPTLDALWEGPVDDACRRRRVLQTWSPLQKLRRTAGEQRAEVPGLRQ
jgi:hypothetical protein